MLSPVTVLPTPPEHGTYITLRPDTIWGTENARLVWHSTVSTFRVDGSGASRIKDTMAVWGSLQTIDGLRAYRKVHNDGVSGKDVRWFLSEVG